MSVPDNGPVIASTTWVLTLLCGAFLGLRVYAKLSRKQRLWWDDYVLIVSWIFLLTEAITTQIGVQLGFGKRTLDVPAPNRATIALGVTAVASLSCFASTLSKISFGITLLRLTNGLLRAFVWFCIITLFVIMIPSATLLWVQCTPIEKAWKPMLEGKCWDPKFSIRYGIFNAAWCAGADIALAMVPWKLLWGLQLKTKEKIGVGVAMSLGVLAGMCAVIKGLYLMQLQSQDFYHDGKDVTIWTVVETATAIIAASIPVLRVFFKDKVNSYSRSNGKSGSNSNARSIPLSHLSRSHPHSHSVTVQSIGKGKEAGWTTLEPIEDGTDDGASQRGILRTEEHGPSLSVGSPGIMQTSSFTITVDQERRSWHKSPV